MGAGQFYTQIATSHRVLRDIGLDSEWQQGVKYVPGMAAMVRRRTYSEEFSHYVTKRLYDLRLDDGSLLQFKPPAEGSDEYSYCYYQSPAAVMAYREFVRVYFPEFPEDEYTDLLQEDYDLYVTTAGLKDTVTPIRFDYSPSLYKSGVHPAAHLHVGCGNEIRIGAQRLLMPLSFCLFVVRQMYPEYWKRFLELSDAVALCRAIREDLESVDAKFFAERDKMEMVLG